MINSIAFDSLRARRPIVGATALWLLLGFSGAVSATSLQDMFKTGETFTQDGLVFSNFAPVLANAFPAGQDLENLLKKDPLALFNVQALDFAAGKFSHGWGNARAADAGNIELVILADNGATAGVDPGFRLNSAGEWTVTAGNIASGQLSAFAYEVKKTGVPKISSADISQISTIDAVGPDILKLVPPVELPDVAAGFALQFIMDLNSNDPLKAILNVTLDLGVQSPTGVMRFSQFDSWSGFSDRDARDAIRVVNVIGVGASSGGGFTMNALEQRIDPPPPQIPQPGTLLLISIGLVGLACRRRRSSATSKS